MTVDLADNFVRVGVPTELLGFNPSARAGRCPCRARDRPAWCAGRRARLGRTAHERSFDWSRPVVGPMSSSAGRSSGWACSPAMRRRASRTRQPYAVIAHAPLEAGTAVGSVRSPSADALGTSAQMRCSASRGTFFPAAWRNGRPRQLRTSSRTASTSNAYAGSRPRRAGTPWSRRRRSWAAVGREGFDLLIRAHEVVQVAASTMSSSSLARSLNADHYGGSRRVSVSKTALLSSASKRNPFPRLAGAEALVVPSRLEGFSLSVLEALALGVPVIANRSAPGVSECSATRRDYSSRAIRSTRSLPPCVVISSRRPFCERVRRLEWPLLSGMTPPAPVPHTCPSSAVSCASPPGRVGSSERAARESALVVAADRDVTNRIRDPRRARGGVVAILDGARRYAARRKARHPARGCGLPTVLWAASARALQPPRLRCASRANFPPRSRARRERLHRGPRLSSCAIAKVGQCASGTVSTSTRTFAS